MTWKSQGFMEEVMSRLIKVKASRRVGNIGPWPNMKVFNKSDQK
jgi:hypothetical protein